MQAVTETWRELAIAIPTFRRNKELLAVLSSIAGQSTRPRMVIVIDNSPDDGARRTVLEFSTKAMMPIDYLPQSENRGPAGAFAAAIELLASRSDQPHWMMCRGDDNPFHVHDALASMHAFARRVAERSPAAIGMHGERYDLRNARTQRISDDELLPDKIISVDCIPGLGSPIYHLPTLTNSGISFDPLLFFGYEELDIGMRLRGAGHSLLVDGSADYELRRRLGILALSPNISVYGNSRPTWRKYFSYRNGLLIARRHADFVGLARLAVRSLKGAGGALVRRHSLTEAAGLLTGLIDGLSKPRPPRGKYVPTSAHDVAVTSEHNGVLGRSKPDH